MKKQSVLPDLYTLAVEKIGVRPMGKGSEAFCRLLAQEIERLTRKIERDRAIDIVTQEEDSTGRAMSIVKHKIRGKENG